MVAHIDNTKIKNRTRGISSEGKVKNKMFRSRKYLFAISNF